MGMLEIFAYHTVVHFTDQNWISNLPCIVLGVFYMLNFFKLVLQTEMQKSHFCVRPWSLLTILNFSEREKLDVLTLDVEF